MDFVTHREAEIKKIIAEAQDAKNNETKSSAGDKYETAREVMQQEINLNLARLNELGKLRATLEHISPSQSGVVVLTGSVVYTNNGNFYIAISAGKILVDSTSFFGISAASPIGAKLMGKEAGYSFELNGKKFVIEKVL
ncbi:MAG: 3-oxoacyl-ACP synthase [Sphingobacteriales bacterium]|nr:MAG: 3-oxoacyl-ACP synthase [Sphingobacteriales bacterium]